MCRFNESRTSNSFSEIVDFGVTNYNSEYKFIYLARWLHYIKHYSISDALYTAAINERDFNTYLATDYREYKFKRIEEFSEDRITADVIMQLKKTHRILMKIKYDIGYMTIKDLSFSNNNVKEFSKNNISKTTF